MTFPDAPGVKGEEKKVEKKEEQEKVRAKMQTEAFFSHFVRERNDTMETTTTTTKEQDSLIVIPLLRYHERQL